MNQIPITTLSKLINSVHNLFLLFCLTVCCFSLSHLQSSAQSCSGTTIITASQGVLTDGSGDGLYLPNLSCVWVINPPGQNVVRIEFTEFEIQGFFSDYVAIYDGESVDAPLIDLYTGDDLPPVIYAYSGSATIYFFSNIFDEYSGWSLDYSTYPAFGYENTFDISDCQDEVSEISFSSVEEQDDFYIISGAIVVDGEASPWKSIVPTSAITEYPGGFYINEGEEHNFPFSCIEFEP